MSRGRNEEAKSFKTHPSRPKFVVLENCMTAAGYFLMEKREAHIIQHGGKKTIKLLAKITRSIDDRTILSKVRKDGVREDRSQKTSLDDDSREKFYRDWELLWIPTLPDREELSPTMLIVATLEPFDINYPQSSSRPEAPKVDEDEKEEEGFAAGDGVGGNDDEEAPPQVKGTSREKSSSNRVRMVNQPAENKLGTSERHSKSETKKNMSKVSANLNTQGFHPAVEAEEEEVEGEAQTRAPSKPSKTEMEVPSIRNEQGNNEDQLMKEANPLATRTKSAKRRSSEKVGSDLQVGELRRIIKEEIAESNEELVTFFKNEMKETEKEQEAKLQQIEDNLHREISDIKTHDSNLGEGRPEEENEGHRRKHAESGGSRESCICQKYHLFGKSHRCPHGSLPEFSRTSSGGIRMPPPLPPRTSRLEDDSKFKWLFEPSR